MTITRRRATIVAAASIGTVLTGGRSAFPAAAATVRFGYQRSSTLLTILKANGTLEKRFADKGFGVSWHLFDNVLDPMNSGALDFYSDAADTIPVFAQSAKASFTYYAREVGSPSAEAMIVHADSPVRTVADLKGKAVAVDRGSGSHFVLAAALKRVGLGLGDVKAAYLKPSDAVAAFERRSVDALSIWDPFLAILESKLPTRTLCDATGLTHYHRYYTANTGFLDHHLELVAIVFDALVETGRWVRQQPREAAEVIAPLMGGIPISVVETIEHRRTYDVQPVERNELGDQQVIADAFFAAGLLSARLDATDVRIWQRHEPT